MHDEPDPLWELSPRPAFLSDEPQALLRFLLDALAENVGCGLATLVEIRGGSARALGAQMAVRADGLFCGHVSGGCVEAAVARETMIAISNCCDRFLHLGDGSPFFDIRLPCGGGIRLAIHVLRNDQALRTVLDCLSRRRPAALVYDATSQRLEATIGQRPAYWRDDGFLLPYRPRVRALLAGQPMEVAAVVDVTAAAGYETVVVSSAIPDMEIDKDTAVVLLQHDVDRELPFLLRAFESPAFYIGALGSARTHQRRCAALRERGVEDASLSRIHAPIGLFPKARDVRLLALSVVAEIAVVRSAFTA